MDGIDEKITGRDADCASSFLSFRSVLRRWSSTTQPSFPFVFNLPFSSPSLSLPFPTQAHPPLLLVPSLPLLASFVRPLQQLRKAITPHARYIPPWMTHKAMELRVDAWLQTNWTQKAVEAIEREPERWVGYVSTKEKIEGGREGGREGERRVSFVVFWFGRERAR